MTAPWQSCTLYNAGKELKEMGRQWSCENAAGVCSRTWVCHMQFFFDFAKLADGDIELVTVITNAACIRYQLLGKPYSRLSDIPKQQKSNQIGLVVRSIPRPLLSFFYAPRTLFYIQCLLAHVRSMLCSEESHWQLMPTRKGQAANMMERCRPAEDGLIQESGPGSLPHGHQSDAGLGCRWLQLEPAVCDPWIWLQPEHLAAADLRGGARRAQA